MNKPLPVRALLLNSFEFGWLYGALGRDGKVLRRMEKECPRMYLRMSIMFCEAYLTHPELGKQAQIEIDKYTKRLRAILNEDNGDKQTI